MEAIKIFGASILIGLIIYLITRWSNRKRQAPECGASPPAHHTSPTARLEATLGSIEEALRDSLGEPPLRDSTLCSSRGSCAGCSGQCNSSLPDSRPPHIIYYDDEELDQLARRPLESYTDEEIELLREVAETLCPEDRQGWIKSLAQREILLPAEILSLLNDNRS